MTDLMPQSFPLYATCTASSAIYMVVGWRLVLDVGLRPQLALLSSDTDRGRGGSPNSLSFNPGSVAAFHDTYERASAWHERRLEGVFAAARENAPAADREA